MLTQEITQLHDIALHTLVNNDNRTFFNNDAQLITTTITSAISCMTRQLSEQSERLEEKTAVLEEQTAVLQERLDQLHDLRSLSTSSSTVSRPLNFDVGDLIDQAVRDIRTSSTPTHQAQSSAPAIQPPFSTRTNTANQKVLLLTDSILMKFNPALYKPRDSSAKMDITKRTLYKLHEIDTTDFEQFDTVVISAGINDLSNCGFTPRKLFELVSKRLSNVNTAVIFRALTPTNFGILNESVYELNNLMFDYILGHKNKNFLYYDPYRFENWEHFIYPQGNGIHLNYNIAIYMSMDIMNHVQRLYLGTRSTSSEHWPLRPSFRARVENYY